MLVHLSNTSPYVCDLSRGPIEQSNRMASAPTKKGTALLEHKESFPKGTRTPLKLLAPDEVPMDTTATATDINASLQPIWYTEQTIVDEHVGQHEDIAAIIQEQQQKNKSLLPRSTLPTIPSESPSILDDEPLPPSQTSLMHKSSTFTIETSTIEDSPLNDSEKENTTDLNKPPTDDSFRALEQLLGLGSNTTVRDSPKTNHDTLSLTVVTPTDIINATTTSLRMSMAPKSDSDSLPSSQDLPVMPTIESINSTNPPSFLMNNTTMEIEATTTTINGENTLEDETNADDDTNFSFELNDFRDSSKHEEPVAAASPASQPAMPIRAPTCADVAYRALVKRKTGGRISQPIKADSPLARPNKLRSSAPTSRMLRSSCRRISTEASAQDDQHAEQPETTTTTECFVNEPNNEVDTPAELVEMVTVPEEDENEQEKTASMTLNLSSPQVTEQFSTPTRPMMPMLSREYTYNTPTSRASERQRSMVNTSHATTSGDEPNSSMLNILLTKPTEAIENVRKSARKATSIASKSMLGVLLTQPTEAQPNVPTPKRKSRSVASKSTLDATLTPPTETEPSVPTPKRRSRSVASKSMLGVLLTQPTEATPTVETPTRKSRSIASKSMLGVLLTQPTEATPTVETPTRKSQSIASKSMLGVLLTQPTETTPTVPTPTRKSRSIASKSMLGVLLTQPTEAAPIVETPKRTSSSIVSKSMLGVLLTEPTAEPATPQTPSIESNSLLGVLLTKPTEVEPTIPASPAQNTVRTSARSSVRPSPRVSINPLHSSTPATSRQKSLQIVSIGEQEQVSTIVPQAIIDEQQEIEIVRLNETAEIIDQSALQRTTEMGVQTTPSLNVSKRRQLNILEPQLTPITDVEQPKEITPLQTKIVVNLQRNVRFQLTPTTDARLAAKEKLEENLRGLKPDIVIVPTPVLPEPKQVKSAPIKKATKPKKKVVALKKKRLQPKRKQSVEKKSPVARKATTPTKETKQKPEPKKHAPRKQTTSKAVVPTKRTSRKQPTPAVTAPTKRVQQKPPKVPVVATKVRKERKAPAPKPTKRVQQKPPKVPVVATKTRTERKAPVPEATKLVQQKPPKVPVVATKTRTERKAPTPAAPEPTKRTSRKRTIPEAVAEPVVKRVRTSKSVEAPAKVRTDSKNNIKTPAEPSQREIRARSRSKNNNEKPSVEPTKVTPVTKTNKRRLQSVDRTEEKKKKVEEEKVQPVAPIAKPTLSEEQRQKIEALTIAGLKSRLNTHKTDVPKGAKKADLVALLIQIESNLLQERQPIESAPVPIIPTTTTTTTTTMTTRRRKN